MAFQSRGGPNVKGTLGTLLRTTMHQVGVVKDAAARQARTQRVWIDSAMLARRRRELLADIGEQVVERIRSGGESELARWLELEGYIEELDALEAEHPDPAASGGAGAAVSAMSGGEKGPREGRARRPEDLRVWRPFAEENEKTASHEVSPSRRGGDARISRTAPKGRGGIAFAEASPGDVPAGELGDEEDLEAYMHDEDVPGAPRRP